MRRTEICGGIASGKTTLAYLLQKVHFVPILEDFKKNPFWEAFYQDPSGNAFETELTFFLQHYHEIKKGHAESSLIACDHSLLLDLAYSRVTLQGNRLVLFEHVFREVWSEVRSPELLVYLRCDPETELQRIRRRAREVENSIDAGYLFALNASLDAVIAEYRAMLHVLEIDSAATNFAEVEEAKTDVRTKVVAALQSTAL